MKGWLVDGDFVSVQAAVSSQLIPPTKLKLPGLALFANLLALLYRLPYSQANAGATAACLYIVHLLSSHLEPLQLHLTWTSAEKPFEHTCEQTVFSGT
jgi:hypothetical protein